MSAMACSRRLLAVIAVGDEGQTHHGGRVRRTADDDIERGADGSRGGLDIAHGDRPAKRRREGAAGDDADRCAARIVDLAALAGGGAAFELQPDAAACRALRNLAPEPVRAGEAALLAPAL